MIRQYELCLLLYQLHTLTTDKAKLNRELATLATPKHQRNANRFECCNAPVNGNTIKFETETCATLIAYKIYFECD